MKRFLAILLCLILLVSCATKKTPVPDFPEEATVGEAITVVDLENVSEEEDVLSVEAEVTEVPDLVEELEEDFLVETEDNVDDVIEDDVTEDDFIKDNSIEEVFDDEASDDSSIDDIGSFVFSEAAPEVPEEEPVEEIAVPEEIVVETSVVEEVVAPVAIAQVPAAQNDETDVELSFVDKLSSFVQKTGSFIVREKLFSVGILSIFVGIVYLIIALIKTSDRHRKHEDYSDVEYEDEEESDFFSDPIKTPTKKKDRSKVDLDLTTEDDEFLRNLLGEDDK